MAEWSKILRRGNVEDRRGLTPVAVGGISLTGVALMFLLNMVTGGSTEEFLYQLFDVVTQQVDVSPNTQQIQDTAQFEGEDSYEVFASSVLGSNNEYWAQVFSNMEETYKEPKLVLFRVATESACGTATSQVGPHYCPLDQTIYLDETFFDELKNRFGAKGGDVAEAYVIGHEVGHHVQNRLGTLEIAQSEFTNQASINLELQADCYAGMWAKSIRSLGVIEPGEINEAMDAAAAVGDDRIQQKATGYINPESWTHGSSAERVEWFKRGYESNSIGTCNTF